MYDDLLGPRPKEEKEIEVGVDKNGNITRTPVPKNVPVSGGNPSGNPSAKPDSDSDEDVWDDIEDLLLEEDCEGDCDKCDPA